MAMAHYDSLHTIDAPQKRQASPTIPSPSSSSIADKLSQDSDDHASIDTMATEKTRYNHPGALTPASDEESHGNMLSQASCHELPYDGKSRSTDMPRSSEREDLAKTIHGLHSSESQSDTDTESDTSDSIRKRERDYMRSTMTSINSLVSSGSNYDLLLARLAPNNPPSATTDTPSSNRSSYEHVYSEGEPSSQEDDIDWDFWTLAITDFDRVASSEPRTLRRNVQKGIPASLRGRIWQLLIDSKDADLEDRYIQSLKEESVYEKAIKQDLSRILSSTGCLQSKDGPEALFNVVKAYALHDPKVGYCSSLSYIAGPLLLNMPEEEAFCMLVKMMERLDLRGLFVLGQERLFQILYHFDGLLGDRCPRIRRHFDAFGLRSQSYAASWFQTLFSLSFSADKIFRIYDVIFAEGIETLYRFALALLEKNQDTILRLDSGHLRIFLNGDLFRIYENNVDLFLHEANQIEISSARLAKLQKEHQAEVASASTETAMLRRQQKALTETVHDMEREFQKMQGMYTDVSDELIKAKAHLARVLDEKSALVQLSAEYKEALDALPKEVEDRVKDEMETLGNKNGELMVQNMDLENQLVSMEKLVIEIKESYINSEKDKKALQAEMSSSGLISTPP